MTAPNSHQASPPPAASTPEPPDPDSAPPPAIPLPRRLRYYAEFLAVRFGRWLIRSAPLRATTALALGGGSLAFLIMARRRRIAIDNILKAGITSDARQAATIARGSFRHFAVMAVESIAAERFLREDNWTDILDVSRCPHLLALARQPGQGLILATAHFGNWEVGAQAFSYLKPVVALARRMNNPYTNNMVQIRNTSSRFRTIMTHEASSASMMEVVKRGEILALLTDQHARYRGMLIPFFGRPAAAHTGVAILHLRSGAPLCFVYAVRTGPMRYQLRELPPMYPQRGQRGEVAVAAVLRALTRGLEDAVRANPEQYLWGHRRWRVDQSHRLRIPPDVTQPA